MTEYFVAMTLQGVQNGGLRTINFTAKPSFDSPVTRSQLWYWMREQLPSDVRDLVVVFFHAEPNAIEHPLPDRGGDGR